MGRVVNLQIRQKITGKCFLQNAIQRFAFFLNYLPYSFKNCIFVAS
jgi:hypothetical protein